MAYILHMNYNKKVVYLFGAGASAKAILPYKSGYDVNLITKFYEFCRLNETLRSFSDEETYSKLLPLFLEADNIYHNLVLNDLTFDEYARELFHSNYRYFKNLKAVMSAFFYYVEFYNTFDGDNKSKPILDMRYRVLLSDFIDQNTQFNNNVKLLTWNYDSQIPLTFKLWNKTIFNGAMSDMFDYSIPFIPLNGTTAVFKKGTSNYFSNAIGSVRENKTGFFEELYDIYINATSSLRFAFEDELDQKSMNYLSNEIAGANKLVIIGYSFPDYNAKYDRNIIGNIIGTCDGKLDIYLQNKNDIKSDFMIRFRDILPSNVFVHDTIVNCDRFFKPFE